MPVRQHEFAPKVAKFVSNKNHLSAYQAQGLHLNLCLLQLIGKVRLLIGYKYFETLYSIKIC